MKNGRILRPFFFGRSIDQRSIPTGGCRSIRCIGTHPVKSWWHTTVGRVTAQRAAPFAGC